MANFPGWGSLESVSRIHHWLELAGIGFLALLVLSEALAFIYSGRKDALTALQAQTVENQRRSEVSSLQAKLTESAQDAEHRIEQLKAQQTGRHLSDEQKRVLERMLAPFSGQRIDVTCILGDTEGKQFAGDFVALLRSAGWNDGGGTGINQAVYGQDPIGIQVTLNDGEIRAGRVPRSANVLVEALFNTGLIVPKQAFRNAQAPADRITLIIGRKPDVH
jgi:hypothetical protein